MIGIIPAAGKATRMNGLPKYLLPLPGGGYLLERLSARMGHVPRFIGANTDNYDLLDAYKRPGDTVYLVMSRSMPQTILAARKYCADGCALVGMPDTYWTDDQVFPHLRYALLSGASCAVAVWEVDNVLRQRLGMCELKTDEGIYVSRIEDKNERTTLNYAWGALAWSEAFWQYIEPADAHMGIALQRAINAGVRVSAYIAQGTYYDCGTPEDYFRCVREVSREFA